MMGRLLCIKKWEVSKGCNLGVMDNIKIEIKGAQKNVILLYISFQIFYAW
jgi:hypothetical protein